jgi:NADPH:quinone reductase-like Zn-dependent oxidoreductase
MGLVQHAYAEQVIARADTLAPIPEGLDFEHAAELPLILLTGAKLIAEGVQPRRGETVLVTGAVGSVGRTAVYLAKKAGAEVLAGVRRRQLSEAEALGVERVVAIDDDAGVRSLPQLDAIADTVGGRTVESLLPALRHDGRIGSVVGEPPGAKERGIAVRAVFAQPDARTLRELAEAVARGELKIPIARTLPLSQIRDAHRLAETGGVIGKVVLTV